MRADTMNIALNRPATQSSTCSWSTDPNADVDARIANDGDLNSGRYFHTNQELDPWWQVDFGDAFLIERVIIHNRTDMPERLRRFTLLRSLDGANWQPFFRKTDTTVSETYVAEIDDMCLARFIRVRLDGNECLHFRECQVFGRRPEAALRERLQIEDRRTLELRHALPPGRNGSISQIGGFDVFVDDENYASDIRQAIQKGYYEKRERTLIKDFVVPGDRVLDIGTAIGVAAMTAASIVGDDNVVTFDANPDIVDDARANFRRNGLSRVVAHCGVLMNRRDFKPDATVEFFIHKAFWASRLRASRNAADIVKTVTIPTFCLEDEIARHQANVLICDIEGGEVDLLARADLTGVRLIILEIHYFATGEQAADAMIRKLMLDGFSIHLVASGGGVLALRR
jgi:FkbM family methyltransferase